ncbi:MAG: hypothetical protein ABIF17_03625 [Patescibacteria group bacterium]
MNLQILEKTTETTNEKPSPDDNILKHIAYFDKHPEQISGEYLVNFLNYIPGSLTRKQFTNYNLIDNKPNIEDEYHSDLRKNQTLREFYTIIEDTIKECNLDLKGIELENSVITNNLDPKKIELANKLIPVYLKLRKMGYSHYDLVQ